MAAFLNTAFAGFDSAILTAMHGLARALGGLLTPLMKFVTLLGEKGLLFLFVALLLMLFPRSRRVGVALFGAIACSFLLNNLIFKELVERLRPFEADPLFRSFWEFVGSPAETGSSFPSGHAAAAAAGCLVLVLAYGRRYLPLCSGYVLLMCLSRAYLMAHYPSDLLFGLLVGCFSAVAAWIIARWIFGLLHRHRSLPLCRFLLYFAPLKAVKKLTKRG